MIKMILTCVHPYTRFGHVVGMHMSFKLWGVRLRQVWKPINLLKLFTLIFYQRSSYSFSIFLIQSIKIVYYYKFQFLFKFQRATKKNKYPNYTGCTKRLRTTGSGAYHTIQEKICEHLVVQDNVGLIHHLKKVIKLFISFMVFVITRYCGDGVTVVPVYNICVLV